MCRSFFNIDLKIYLSENSTLKEAFLVLIIRKIGVLRIIKYVSSSPIGE